MWTPTSLKNLWKLTSLKQNYIIFERGNLMIWRVQCQWLQHKHGCFQNVYIWHIHTYTYDHWRVLATSVLVTYCCQTVCLAFDTSSFPTVIITMATGGCLQTLNVTKGHPKLVTPMTYMVFSFYEWDGLSCDHLGAGFYRLLFPRTDQSCLCFILKLFILKLPL